MIGSPDTPQIPAPWKATNQYRVGRTVSPVNCGVKLNQYVSPIAGAAGGKADASRTGIFTLAATTLLDMKLATGCASDAMKALTIAACVDASRKRIPVVPG